METEHFEAAEACLSAAEAFRVELDEAYANKPPAADLAAHARRSARIGQLHQRIDFAVDAAKIHATLAVEQRIREASVGRPVDLLGRA